MTGESSPSNMSTDVNIDDNELVDNDDFNETTNEVANNDEIDSDQEDPGSPKHVNPSKLQEVKNLPAAKGLGFWLKQLQQSENEASQSNLSTVANVDPNESLDGDKDQDISEIDRGIEFSAQEVEIVAANSSKQKEHESSVVEAANENITQKSSEQDEMSDNEPPDEEPIIKCKRPHEGEEENHDEMIKRALKRSR